MSQPTHEDRYSIKSANASLDRLGTITAWPRHLSQLNTAHGKSPDMPADPQTIARKKAKALSIFNCLMYDKEFDETTLFDEIINMAGDPEIARQLINIFDSHNNCDPQV